LGGWGVKHKKEGCPFFRQPYNTTDNLTLNNYLRPLPDAVPVFTLFCCIEFEGRAPLFADFFFAEVLVMVFTCEPS